MDAYTVLLTVSLLLLGVYLFFFWRKSRNNPPSGPKGYPIIGSSFSIDVKNIHISLTELAETYGEIFEINLFGQTAVVLNSAKIIRDAFLKEPNATIFSNRVEASLTNEMYHGPVDIVFSQYDTDWVKRRKLGHKVLKAYGEGMQTIENNIQNQLAVTVDEIKQQGKNAFDPEKIIDGFLVQLISILLTGRRHDINSEFVKAMVDHDNTLNKILAPEVTFIIDWLPFMRYVPGPVSKRYNDFKQCQTKFYEVIRKEYEASLSTGMIHELLTERNKMADTGKETWLTEDSVNTMLTNLVAGGILTSKGTIWSGIHILLHKLDVQKKLQAEVDGVVGASRQPSLADKEYMPYTEAFILEILRLISHLPLLVPHCVAKDTTLAGYDIQKGTMVLPNIWKIHHDSSVFTDPFLFKPERFMDSDGGLLHADHELRQCLLTFGLGKRSCIGEAFARNRLFLFFSTLMQRFTFVPDPEEDVPKFDPRNMDIFIVNMPKRFKCTVKER